MISYKSVRIFISTLFPDQWKKISLLMNHGYLYSNTEILWLLVVEKLSINKTQWMNITKIIFRFRTNSLCQRRLKKNCPSTHALKLDEETATQSEHCTRQQDDEKKSECKSSKVVSRVLRIRNIYRERMHLRKEHTFVL